MEEKDTKLVVYHRPDYPPELSPLLGNVKGHYGYVTEYGTIRLLGPLYQDPDISKFQVETKINGPLLSMSAVPLGFIG